MKIHHALAAVGLVLGTSCGLFRAAPDRVAEEFWAASVAADFDRAAEYVTESSRGLLERADQAPDIEDVWLGEVEVEDERASVETSVAAMVNGDKVDIDFDTILELEDGEWRVDLSATTGEMMSQFMGIAGDMMGQIGEAIGEQMRAVMQGMMEGLAEGMEQFGKSLQEAMDSVGAADSAGN